MCAPRPACPVSTLLCAVWRQQALTGGARLIAGSDPMIAALNPGLQCAPRHNCFSAIVSKGLRWKFGAILCAA